MEVRVSVRKLVVENKNGAVDFGVCSTSLTTPGPDAEAWSQPGEVLDELIERAADRRRKKPSRGNPLALLDYL